MAIDVNFLEDTIDRLSPLGAISSKLMFGGAGVFVDGKMFVKISPSCVLSFKADDQNKSAFLNAGMKKSGKMPYYEATAEQMEDDEAFMIAAKLARNAALR